MSAVYHSQGLGIIHCLLYGALRNPLSLDRHRPRVPRCRNTFSRIGEDLGTDDGDSG